MRARHDHSIQEAPDDAAVAPPLVHAVHVLLSVLWTTLLTSLGGFFFPFPRLMPSHILGALSLVLLPLAFLALYGKKLDGGWRRVFVLEPPFGATQLVLLLLFLALGRAAWRGFARPVT